MNPYASYLGDRDPVQVIAATTSRLEELWEALGPEAGEHRPAPGKWNVREIICHLADCEMVFAFRFRQTQAEDHPVIQPFDQEKWAAPYAAYDGVTALGAFTAARRWNLAFLGAVPPTAMARPVLHPERGEMTFRTLIETMAGHDINHLRQIEAIAAEITSAA